MTAHEPDREGADRIIALTLTVEEHEALCAALDLAEERTRAQADDETVADIEAALRAEAADYLALHKRACEADGALLALLAEARDERDFLRRDRDAVGGFAGDAAAERDRLAGELERAREALRGIADGIPGPPDSVLEGGRPALTAWMWRAAQESARAALAPAESAGKEEDRG